MAEDTVLMGRGRVAASLGTLRSQLGIFAKAIDCFLAQALHYPKIPASPPPAPSGVCRGRTDAWGINMG